MKPDTVRSGAALASTAGGIAWVLLGPAAVLKQNNTLGYDAYNRLLALPLLLFLVGFVAAGWLLRPRTGPGRAGFVAVALGLVLLLVGNVVEFWGVLLQSKPNAQTAHETGAAAHWIGSDIGWILFLFGMLATIVGGVILALSHRRTPTFPTWARSFLGLLGVGVLAGNLVAGAPFFLGIPVLGLYGAGWIALGRLLRERAGVPSGGSPKMNA
jgi:glucan phosphoethanolaminetransferase (alkaline phosphatase superfamily)